MQRISIPVVIALMIAACGGSTAPTSTGTAAVATAAPSATAANPKWDAAVAAARQEAKVVVWGPTGPELQGAVTQGFKQAYGIDVVFTTTTGSEALARIKAEYQAGRYNVDFIMDGAQTLNGLKTEGFLKPIKSDMLLPEVAEPKNWFDDKHAWSDTEGQYIFIPNLYTSTPLFVNTRTIDPATITSWKALLDPKYKGKIAAMDPTVPGLGQQVAAQILHHLGADYFKQLYVDQAPVISVDERQIAEWIARGQYTFGVGIKETFIDLFIQQGIPLVVLRPSDYPGHITGGAASMGIFAKSPNPNAAVVFFNWITSKDGATTLSKALKVLSARKDVSKDVAPSYVAPQPGVKYGPNTSSAEWQPLQRDYVTKIRQIMGK
jgi:iron(III) transport system substrate-binding protein